MSQKLRYETDPHNRLIVGERGQKSPLERFRKVLDGRFRVDEHNTLSYHVKKPVEDKNIPHQFKLEGEWSLTDDHDLKFTLNKWGRETFGDKLTIKGQIIDVRKNSILFAVTTITKTNTRSTYVLNLQGSWQADKYNRLTFKLKREKGCYNILTFTGQWEVNKNHQIIYRYRKAGLLRTEKKSHTLTFSGHWNLADKARISYIIDGNTGSVFNFKITSGIYCGEKYIKYEIGVGASKSKQYQTITLSGRWRLRRNRGLMFEIEYGGGDIRSITFGADMALTEKDTLMFRLKNDTQNKDLDMTLELSRKILKGDGTAFFKAIKEGGEIKIYAGGAWRF